LALPTEPPTTLYELERIWRTLKGRPDLFARYLRTFKTTTLKKVLKQAATPELLSDVLQTTNEFLAAQHPKSAVRVLQGVARCPCFAMMVALMFDADKLGTRCLPRYTLSEDVGTDTKSPAFLCVMREYAYVAAVRSAVEKLRGAGVDDATLEELEREYGL
jgi:hypothetical protein